MNGKAWLRSLPALLLISMAAAARGQGALPELPQDPAVWLNSPPISLKAITGKAAALYFYEES